MRNLSTLQVELGDVSCSIICHDPRLFTYLGDLFENFRSQRTADITIELEVVDSESPDRVNATLPRIRISQEENRFMADELVLESEFSLSDRCIRLRVERSFFAPGVEFKLMNRVLTLAYYTVCRWKYGSLPPAMVVHSSGIVRRGKALLFTGPSGSGKTTVARLCSREQGEVLNDEMTLVTQPQSGLETVIVRGIPIIGDLPQRLNTEAPLRCVFSLKQGKQTIVRRLSRVEAYLRFMRQIISPAYFGQTDRQALFSQIADFSDEITSTIPFYELEFALDQERLWRVVGELEEALEKEEVKIG